MARIVKAEVKPGEVIPAPGTDFHGLGIVKASFPENNDPNITVELYGHREGDVDALDAATVEYRDEHTDYHPMTLDPSTPTKDKPSAGKYVCRDGTWTPENLEPGNPQVGDTYALVGVNDDTWKRGKWGGAPDVLFMIGDTGFDPNHVAFDGKGIEWWAAAGGGPRDTQGHGTHTTATAVSAWGIATDAHAIHFLFLDGQGGTGSESGIAVALRAVGDTAVQRRVRIAVLSLSLGGSHSSVIDAGVQYCLDRGVIVVAAAGNDGQTPGSVVGSPADQPGVVVVGACDRARLVAFFSTGNDVSPMIWDYDQGIDVASAKAGTRDQAVVESGTSMATPHTAGQIMLLAASGMSRDDILNYVKSHQTPLSPAARNGKGQFTLASDFGDAAPPVNPPVEPPMNDVAQQISDNLREAQNQLGNPPDGARYQEPPATATKAQLRSWAKDMQARSGIAWDYMEQSIGLLPN